VARSSDWGILQAGRQTCLDLEVSQESLRRVLLVMDALIEALERRGFAVSTVEGKVTTRLTVLGETVEIGIEERVDRSERPLTQAREREEKREPRMCRYAQYEFVPSGILSHCPASGGFPRYRGGGVTRIPTWGRVRIRDNP
jgi:hypothetical protein